MKKFLVGIFTLALVLSISTGAFAEGNQIQSCSKWDIQCDYLH